MKIPQGGRDGKAFFERLRDPVVLDRQVGERTMRFVVEPTQPGFIYPCTVDDACRVLGACPAEFLQGVPLVVFRQPSRKQRVLNPVWGRAVFWFDFGRDGGSAVVIEAQCFKPIRWGPLLSLEERLELNRLSADGHRVERVRRGYEIHMTPESLRNTVLYRTLLHEIGHHVDFDLSSAEEWAGKTKKTKEDLAHRFASNGLELLKSQGLAPFAPLLDAAAMSRDGLDVAWFVAEPQDL